MRGQSGVYRPFTARHPAAGQLPTMSTAPTTNRNGIDTGQVYGTLDAL